MHIVLHKKTKGYYYPILEPKKGLYTEFVIEPSHGNKREWCVWVATFKANNASRGKAIFKARTLKEIKEFISMCMESLES